VGRVRFGSLERLTPVSPWFGSERGRPVDRYYIERFLEAHRGDIRGRVLEAGDRGYTTRYGQFAVTRSDVLNVMPGAPETTIVADLEDAEGLPRAAFDCLILTQVLHLIYDVAAALTHCRAALRPGGVLLATLPGISQISRLDADRGGDYWRFTSQSVRRLFERSFADPGLEIAAHGNVLVATAFLYGLCVEDLRRAWLDHHDPDYELLITVRATHV
jgi:SAM-dependent methyltransferase